MAYDQELDDRVARIVGPWGAVRKTMFGGTGYMLNGNLMGGVHKDKLIVRLSAEDGAAALEKPHVDIFEITRRPMPGWITVDQAAVASDKALAGWLERGRKHAESLPPK